MFKVEVIGNLGGDAEIREANGSKFVSFRVAHTDKWTTQSGEKKEVTVWIDVTMSNHESKVIPFLKAGVKVFVRGNGSLRVYSSPKDKCMKAGLQISALEVELCGGITESVPRQLIDPDTAQILDVSKYYWCNLVTEGMKQDEKKMLIDEKGHQYICNALGFVSPMQEEKREENDSSSANQADNAEKADNAQQKDSKENVNKKETDKKTKKS